jgi:pilus assembly protein Flp/PilA
VIPISWPKANAIGKILRAFRQVPQNGTGGSGFIFSTWESTLLVSFGRFLKDERGATAIEYGLIAAGIALAIIAAVNGLGSTLNTKFTTLNTSLK